MSSAKKIRVDLALIAGMVQPRARVLDVGCADGQLVEHLIRAKQCDARGIEIDMDEVQRAIAHGLPVMQGDADTELVTYPDHAFDYVILSRTLQAVEQPREVLRQMLRISTHAIVSFPNFGHWSLRLQLLTRGRMPMTAGWNRMWYETPNIHPCTIKDFFALCDMDGYVVQDWLAADEEGRRTPWRRAPSLANLFGEQGLFLLRKA
ncbi:methionine biosynthesis protein MetW [Acidocella aminolytica]|jgi:methionine biosynthesis protein MetW|uniref:Methionine biosynthesis MetW n=1 Tax=Acidocella aminolytica 101 = DSM 11237 TaxID=1120923 RepID=A0A0D6PFM2_9PROT|nr:methionine biosynthesis protein MetW [Acidocella aminolytica]GAN80146.1 methionine biosynthesis MetW [Acidocella aminolytica 101 = DSM 11237]SHE87814.1 methionine biosynthesis protein MetW [Acidocella aminolytica 101 = DSM 11237]